MHWGVTIENALEEAVQKAKNDRAAAAKQVMVFNKYLKISKFRDPAGRG
jgi:hypothetical protein